MTILNFLLDLLIPGKLAVTEELFQKGLIFMRNDDINCIPMSIYWNIIDIFKYYYKKKFNSVHFVIKNHRKEHVSQIELFKFISYFFEKAYKFNTEDPIVLVFDMSDAGYANLVKQSK